MATRQVGSLKEVIANPYKAFILGFGLVHSFIGLFGALIFFCGLWTKFWFFNADTLFEKAFGVAVATIWVWAFSYMIGRGIEEFEVKVLKQDVIDMNDVHCTTAFFPIAAAWFFLVPENWYAPTCWFSLIGSIVITALYGIYRYLNRNK